MEWEARRGRENKCVSFDKYVKINDAQKHVFGNERFSQTTPKRRALDKLICLSRHQISHIISSHLSCVASMLLFLKYFTIVRLPLDDCDRNKQASTLGSIESI